MRSLILLASGLVMLLGSDLASAGVPPGEPAPGVSHTLAIWRASRYSQIEYAVQLDLRSPFDSLRGELRISVNIGLLDADLLLDWRPASDARVWNVTVNGSVLGAISAQNEHIVIPQAALRAGGNVIALAFESPIAASGSAITRFHDPEDGAVYLYSLLVPADASSVFPCFDQPDLKARFALSVKAPREWRVIGNSATADTQQAGEQAITRLARTEPISTYVFAFAAGPFSQIDDRVSATKLFVRQSRTERGRQEADEVLRLTREGAGYFAGYFNRPFPFSKYDLVLIPELAYGGMEHAGATFLREDSVLFPFQPAAADRLRRAQLIFHETAHQWFGDLVTMRWFDDLWLKEGFANFMAAKATAALLPEFDAWNAFRAVKVAAYRTDVTRGTTPIWQSLPNLSAAKSAYGSIVYSKAPAVLRQAEYFLGEDIFRKSVVSFVAEHAYGAADWNDLVREFEAASGRGLQAWAHAWVERRGLPEIRADWQVSSEGGLTGLKLSQIDALGENGIWPMRLQLVLGYGDGKVARFPALLDGAMSIPLLDERPAPLFVFANGDDFGYGLFFLYARSRAAMLTYIGSVKDAFLRSMLWDALWESVRAAELAPLDYLDLAIRELPKELDEVTASGILARVQTVFRWYLSNAQQAAVAARLEGALRDGMLNGPNPGLRITWFRAYASLASTSFGLDALKHLLTGELAIPDVTLSSNERSASFVGC
ncbi:MAG: M1 family aminopeptidase [Betaproteobacteria bacterium]